MTQREVPDAADEAFREAMKAARLQGRVEVLMEQLQHLVDEHKAADG